MRRPRGWNKANTSRGELRSEGSVAMGEQFMQGFVSSCKNLGLDFQGDGHLLKGLNQGHDIK